MSLIKCPECNKSISSKAETCPHCGYILEKSSFILWIMGLLVLILLAASILADAISSYK